MTMVTIIGRGHSGTRAISHTLTESGAFMGEPLNKSGDLLPPQDMYDACRVLAPFIQWKGGLEWDWSALHTMDIPESYTQLIQRYLTTVLASPNQHKGWKIPETTLVFPWIVRQFPEIKYIYWIRNPRDCILGGHLTDNLNDFGIPYPPTEDERLRRAISWKYQYDLVQSMVKPKYWFEVRFEDFILDQDATLARLEQFLGFPLAKIEVHPETVNRWKEDEGLNYYDFFEPAMR
ncbi:MAG: sulfotransferase, partial [Anaerolineaceae bacterium]|nr:sulfotransferase [Anaerolineaceae bacterium]